MDKRIKEAAENDLHSYEEKSWPKMEELLDKHLPQEKKRRRFIFFILLFLGLGLGGSAIYFISNPSPDNKLVTTKTNNTIPINAQAREENSSESSNNNISAKPNTSASQDKTSAVQTTDNTFNNDQQQDLSSNKELSAPQKIKSKTSSTIVAENTDPIKKEKDQTAIKKTPKNVADQNKTQIVPIVQEEEEKNNKTQKDKDDIVKKDVSSNPVTDPSSPGNVTAPIIANSDANNKSIEEKTIQQEAKPDATEEKVDAEKKQDADPTTVASTEPEKKEKTKKQKGNKLILSLSAGPDMSFVSADPGTMKMQYGIGVGYAISDRFTVRTGFYAVRKIYSADSNSYHSPFNSGPYYGKLAKVDANCLVYEIPVTVVYNFARTKNHNWFVSTGLSSYIMKEEDYLCTYKNPWGQIQTHNYSYTDNSHLFSVLNLSGGYQYHFNKRLSLMAEPYLKLPLTGVGFGKVNLNSAGVLFTVGYMPFLKSK